MKSFEFTTTFCMRAKILSNHKIIFLIKSIKQTMKSKNHFISIHSLQLFCAVFYLKKKSDSLESCYRF